MPWGHASLNGSRVEAYAKGENKDEYDSPHTHLTVFSINRNRTGLY
jgi:hypothetical protein